jgi:hypothetical protein
VDLDLCGSQTDTGTCCCCSLGHSGSNGTSFLTVSELDTREISYENFS